MSELPALIVAITGLVSAIGAIVIGVMAHGRISAVQDSKDASK